MIAKRIGVLLVAVTMAASGAYVFVYLQRWEWNRALIAGTFMLASEMIIVAAVLASIAAAPAHAGAKLNGFTLNGFTLNGFTLNGFTLNGFSLNGFKWNGFTLNDRHQGVGLSGQVIAIEF